MTKFGLFCLFTPIKVALISTLISFVFISIWLTYFRTPPQHNCDMSGILYGIVLFINIMALILTYSICLNFYKTVREQKYASLATFFMPILIVCLLFVSDDPAIMLFAIPFVVPQAYYYHRFRKRLESGELLEDFYE